MRADTLQIVLECWSQTLPSVPVGPATSWDETGADSLRGLQLLLRLERALGRRIPTDLLGPETSPAALAAMLDGAAPPAGGDRPTMILLPGLFGDEPRLAAFRRAFRGNVDFTVVELPDLDVPAAVSSSIRGSARYVADRVAALRPDGDLMLGGYSIGGIVALECAAILRERGRQVRLLLLLDPFLQTDVRKPFRLEAEGQPPRRVKAATTGAWRRYGERLGFAVIFLVGGVDAARRRLLGSGTALDPSVYFWRRRRIIGRARARALRRWRPSPYPGNTLLVLSDEAADHYDVGRWQAICPDRATIEVGGAHLELFRPDALDRMAPAVAAAIAGARPAG